MKDIVKRMRDKPEWQKRKENIFKDIWDKRLLLKMCKELLKLEIRK